MLGGDAYRREGRIGIIQITPANFYSKPNQKLTKIAFPFEFMNNITQLRIGKEQLEDTDRIDEINEISPVQIDVGAADIHSTVITSNISQKDVFVSSVVIAA